MYSYKELGVSILVLSICLTYGPHLDWKTIEHFIVWEKSENFDQTGKSQGILPKLLGKSGNIVTGTIT